MKILFVNACVRGETSNTKKLCQAALEELQARYPEAVITEVNLEADRPQALYPEDLSRRNALRKSGELSDAMFDYAHQFAAADKIVIGAPYWDLSFPAVLKIYFEHVCVVGISFSYTDDGGPVGTCCADELLYVTSSGGPIAPGQNMGFDYIKGLCDAFYNIPKLRCFALQGVEMGGDIAAMVQAGQAQLRLGLREDSL